MKKQNALAALLIGLAGFSGFATAEDTEEAVAPSNSFGENAGKAGYVELISLLRSPTIATIESACVAPSVEWRRDRDLVLCAAPCTSDADCIEGAERCRLFLFDAPAENAVLASEADVEAELGAGATGLCDPFWDVDGALDAFDANLVVD